MLAPPRRIGGITVEVMIAVGYAFGFELHVDGKTTHGVRHGQETSVVGRAQEMAALEHLEQAIGMHRRDHKVGRMAFSIGCHHSRSSTLIAHHLHRLATREHRSTQTLDGLYQRTRDDIAAPGNAKCTAIVEIGDESMGRKRCFPSLGGIQRKVAHEHAA